MKLFIISDHHFNHYNIIKYADRPFMDIEQMNKYMIKAWNSVVNKSDFVFHLGDIGFGNIKEILSELNGEKGIILGNHDRFGKNRAIEMGFKYVFKKPVVINNIVYSHKPCEELSNNYINFHGHIHNKKLDGKYVNFSVEAVNYVPVEMDNEIKHDFFMFLEKNRNINFPHFL